MLNIREANTYIKDKNNSTVYVAKCPYSWKKLGKSNDTGKYIGSDYKEVLSPFYDESRTSYGNENIVTMDFYM